MFQDLTNVCSVRHAHHLTYATHATALQALKAITDGRSVICFVGPNQEIIRDVFRKAKRKYNEDIRRLYSWDTGHGGETEIWLLINRGFRKDGGSIARLFSHLTPNDF